MILLFSVRTIIFANYSKSTMYSMLKMISNSSILGKAQLIHIKGAHFPLFFQKRKYKSVFLHVGSQMCPYSYAAVYFKYKTIFLDHTRQVPTGLDHNDPSKPSHRLTNGPEPSKTIESDGSNIKKPS